MLSRDLFSISVAIILRTEVITKPVTTGILISVSVTFDL